MKRFKINFLLFLIILFVSGCIQKRAIDLAPSELIGMKGRLLFSGEKAIETVKRSHIGKIEHIKDLAIFEYAKNNKSLTLWITLYPNSQIAKQETLKMVHAMLRFKEWAKIKKREINEKVIFYVPREKETHYFWYDKSCVFYFVSKNLKDKEVKEVINKLKCQI